MSVAWKGSLTKKLAPFFELMLLRGEPTLLVQQDILRLDVAVDDAPPVQVLDGERNFTHVEFRSEYGSPLMQYSPRNRSLTPYSPLRY